MESTKELGGHHYVIGKLNAFEQLHIARRLAPMLSSLVSAFASASALLASEDTEAKLVELVSGPLADAFAQMKDEDVDYIVNTCLSACQRKQSHGYAKVFAKGGGLMFQDIQLDTLIGLTWHVIQENLGSFFPISPRTLDEQK